MLRLPQEVVGEDTSRSQLKVPSLLQNFGISLKGKQNRDVMAELQSLQV